MKFKTMLLKISFLGLCLLTCGAGAQTVSSPVPEPLRSAFKLDGFYQKSLDASGLPIVASAKVRDQALREAAWIVDHLLAGRDDIRAALAANKVRLAVMAYNEYTTDLPENAELKNDRDYWDRRARGLGPSPEAPAVSCGEENLLCFPGDHYAAENILIHEFAHAIHQMGLSKVDPTFDGRLNKAYTHAVALGRWKGFYAGSNPAEYWAEGVQSWFDNNRENDASHNFVNTRAELKEYDPELAALCKEIFGDGDWRYKKPADRAEKDREHLKGYDPQTAPEFKWRPGTEDATKGRS